MGKGGLHEAFLRVQKGRGSMLKRVERKNCVGKCRRVPDLSGSGPKHCCVSPHCLAKLLLARTHIATDMRESSVVHFN